VNFRGHLHRRRQLRVGHVTGITYSPSPAPRSLAGCRGRWRGLCGMSNRALRSQPNNCPKFCAVIAFGLGERPGDPFLAVRCGCKTELRTLSASVQKAAGLLANISHGPSRPGLTLRSPRLCHADTAEACGANQLPQLRATAFPVQATALLAIPRSAAVTIVRTGTSASYATVSEGRRRAVMVQTDDTWT
jgi:hypothetical protein